MLRGNSPAKVDGKGRVIVPSAFRKYVEEKYGRECFVTSYNGEFARVYPMPVWIEIETKLSALPSMHPSAMRFLNFVNYYGQVTSMDDQGRLLIHPLLRQKSGINGNVAVLGKQTYLDIWNREKFEAMLAANPVTDDDRLILTTLGV